MSPALPDGQADRLTDDGEKVPVCLLLFMLTTTNRSHSKSLCTVNIGFYYVMPYTYQSCPNHPDKGHRKIMFENRYLLNTGQFTI